MLDAGSGGGTRQSVAEDRNQRRGAYRGQPALNPARSGIPLGRPQGRCPTSAMHVCGSREKWYESRIGFSPRRLPRSTGRRGTTQMMKRWQKLASAAILACAMTLGGPGAATAQTKPEAEMRFALYVTVAP